MWLNDYKVLTNLSKLKNEKQRNCFTDLIYRMIMKARMISNALLMLNLEKESFIGNIVLKCSFKMALMSVKNLVYNKLARQHIFFALSIQFRFLLF